MSAPTRIAVIGGGYAGLAAAVELSHHGRQVDVFEASRVLGGRARAVRLGELTVDNGQHILIGAYRETLRLMRCVGSDPDKLLRRLPLRLEFPGEFRMVAPRWPAPLHTAAALLGARGIDWHEKWAALRLMMRLQRDNFRIVPDMTLGAWLDRHAIPSRQRRLLWEPLCIAALNTPSERASAQVFAHVLRDSLAADRAASDLLLPQTDLTSLFPAPAAKYIAAHGGKVHRSHRVNRLLRYGQGWQVDDGEIYAQVIVAVAPYHLTRLLPELKDSIDHFEWEPIVTSYLCYPPEFRLKRPMLGVHEGLSQWLFDRGQLGGQLSGQAGVIASVISARGRHLKLSTAELELGIHSEILRHMPNAPTPHAVHTLTEKRATFACLPDLPRPSPRTPLPQLWLAGDYIASEYPATLEGAVRSGVAAAQLALTAPAS